MRKRHLTLVEVLVAMGLFSILMTVLFGMYTRVNKMQFQADSIQAKATEYNNAYIRLSTIIPKITLGVDARGRYHKEEIKELFFFTKDNDDKGQRLEFIYDNGVTLLPKFSAYTHGSIYVERDQPKKKDEKGELCLWLEEKPSPAQFPDSERELRKEKLLSGVERIDFKFFLPENAQKNFKQGKLNLGRGKGGDQPGGDRLPEGEETTVWSSKDWGMLPAMMQIEIKKTGDDPDRPNPITWIFYLPNSGHKIKIK